MVAPFVKPYAFDRVFGAAEPRAGLSSSDLTLALAAAEAELAVLREQQTALIEQARADGHAAGHAAAREEREEAILAAVDALHAGLDAIDETLDARASGIAADAAELALTVGEVLAGHAIAVQPGLAVDEAVARALRQVARGQELVVYIHPALREEMKRRLAARQAGDRRRLCVHFADDPTLAPGDGRIEWDQGGLVIDAAARRAAVQAELASLCGATAPDGTAPTRQ